MKSALDARFETLFLLASTPWDQARKEQAVEALDSLGLNGRALYAAHFPVVERYFAAFESKRIESEGTQMLGTLDNAAFLVYAGVLLRNEAWFDGLDCVSDEAAREASRAAVLELSDGKDTVFEVLEEEGFTDQARWQIMSLVEQPRQKLAPVIQAVRQNTAAYDFTCSKVAPELDALLARFSELSGERDPSMYRQLARGFDPDAKIVPTLALPLVVLGLGDVWFYGLLVDQVIAGEALGYSQAEIVLGAKALGDASKVEILSTLKHGSLYSLEIAKAVGLTPATVSHHMNTLLTAGFVTMEKREGKVYYRLSEEGIVRYLDGIKACLL